jgi:uncharacterized protein with HEPN domain
MMTSDEAYWTEAEEALTSILTLAEGLDEGELTRSRLTRGEVRRQTLLVSGALDRVSEQGRASLPELDWAAWRATAERMGRGGTVENDALWFAVRALAPTTLTWLRLRRRELGGVG